MQKAQNKLPKKQPTPHTAGQANKKLVTQCTIKQSTTTPTSHPTHPTHSRTRQTTRTTTQHQHHASPAANKNSTPHPHPTTTPTHVTPTTHPTRRQSPSPHSVVSCPIYQNRPQGNPLILTKQPQPHTHSSSLRRWQSPLFPRRVCFREEFAAHFIVDCDVLENQGAAL